MSAESPAPAGSSPLVLRTTAAVAGGAALGRDDTGRVVFVAGALPGELVEVEITEAKRDFARGRTLAVLEAAPARIEPPCPAVALGCGGCDLQHVDPVAQPGLKRDIVVDALRRIAHLDDPLVEVGAALPATGFRTTVRAAVVDGRAGFRAARSHDVVTVASCLVAHPRLDELLVGGRFDGCDEVTLRTGVATGERLVLADPVADEVELPAGCDDVVVVGARELADGARAWFHEEIDGQRLRISAGSFFQTRPDGAAALVAAVRELGGPELARADTVVDAYAGVGLFGALATADGARVIAVESSRSSCADARQNLARLRGDRAKVVRVSVERWRPSRADVVIADPARTGLGKGAVGVLARCHAEVLVLVSCDPAAFARDTVLLAAAGYRLDRARLVDLFPQTHHIEVVSRFVRDATGPTA